MLLENGEVHQRKTTRGGGEPYERLQFGRYRMAFDLSSLGGFERRSRDGGSRTDRSMRSSQMLVFVDSLEEAQRQREVEAVDVLARRGRPEADTTARPDGTPDARAIYAPDTRPADSSLPPDTSSVLIGADRVVLEGLQNAARETVYDMAMDRAAFVRSEATQIVSAAEWDARRSARYRVEIYKKNSLALACLVFVLIGVPLGLSIQRAGVGLVATLAVSVFLFYWVTLVVGEKLIDRGFFPPWLGMWVANVLVGALGIYLVARETRDPAWRDPIRALAGRFAKRGG